MLRVSAHNEREHSLNTFFCCLFVYYTFFALFLYIQLILVAVLVWKTNFVLMNICRPHFSVHIKVRDMVLLFLLSALKMLYRITYVCTLHISYTISKLVFVGCILFRKLYSHFTNIGANISQQKSLKLSFQYAHNILNYQYQEIKFSYFHQNTKYIVITLIISEMNPIDYTRRHFIHISIELLDPQTFTEFSAMCISFKESIIGLQYRNSVFRYTEGYLIPKIQKVGIFFMKNT